MSFPSVNKESVVFNSICMCGGLSFKVKPLSSAHPHISDELPVEQCSPIVPQQRLPFILSEFQLLTSIWLRALILSSHFYLLEVIQSIPVIEKKSYWEIIQQSFKLSSERFSVDDLI